MRARRALAVRESGASESSEDEDTSHLRSASNSNNLNRTLGSDRFWRRPLLWCALVLFGTMFGAAMWVQQTSKVTGWPVLRRGIIGLYYTFPVFARSVDHLETTGLSAVSITGDIESSTGQHSSTSTTAATGRASPGSSSRSSSESSTALVVSSRCYARPLLPWPLKGDKHGRADVNSNGEETDDWHVPLKDAPIRCLPNFMFIGTSKSGTSSLRSHLVAHPGIRFVRRMQTGAEGAEVHRFDRWDYAYALSTVEKALEWGHSPPVRDPSVPVVHYTPHYLFAPAVPQRIAEFYPHSHEMKFMVLLRDPTTRGVSSYWFKQPNQRGGSPNDFHATMAKEVAQRRRYEACLANAMWGLEVGKDWVEAQSGRWTQEANEWAMGPVLRNSADSSTAGSASTARGTRASSGGISSGTGATMFRGRHFLTVASTAEANATKPSSQRQRLQPQQRQLSAHASLLDERQPWAPEAWAQWKSNYGDNGANSVGSGSSGHSESTCSAGSSRSRGFMNWFRWKHHAQSATETRSLIEACCSAHVMTEERFASNEERSPVPPSTAAAMNVAIAAATPHLRARVNGSASASSDTARRFTSAGGGADMHQHLAKGIYVEQFDRWFGYFSPQHFKVLTTESMKRDGGLPAYEEMCKFLGVKAVGSQFAFSDRTVLKAQLGRRFNEGTNPDTKSLHPRSLALLRQFYAPYVASLERTLTRKFVEWKKA